MHSPKKIFLGIHTARGLVHMHIYTDKKKKIWGILTIFFPMHMGKKRSEKVYRPGAVQQSPGIAAAA